VGRNVNDLVRQLDHSDRQVAAEGIRSIVSQGQEAVPALLSGLRHPSEWVRLHSATALGQLRAADAVPQLIELLRDPEFIVREAAVLALAAIGDRRAVEPLIAALDDDWQDVRQAAAHVLGQFGDERAVWPLVDAMADEDYEVQDNAIGALQRLGPLATDQLEAALRRGDAARRAKARDALSEIRAS
jgi:HEAT repeat protein